MEIFLQRVDLGNEFEFYATSCITSLNGTNDFSLRDYIYYTEQKIKF